MTIKKTKTTPKHLCTAADGDGLLIWENIILYQREVYLCLLEGYNDVAQPFTLREQLFEIWATFEQLFEIWATWAESVWA